MKKTFIVALVSAMMITAVIATSQDTDVSVSVEEACEVSLYNFEQPGVGDKNHKVMGANTTGYFSGLMSNRGTQDANIDFNLTVTNHENRSLEVTENQTYVIPPEDDQPGNYTFETNLTSETHSVNDTQFENFMIEFWAIYNPGNYTGRVEIDYSCGNESDTIRQNRTFEIIRMEGEGVIPDDVGEDDEVDQEVETDAEEPDEVDTEIDLDVDEEVADAEQVEGDSPEPGQTEVPEPEPEPDPYPLLSVSIKPLNTTYISPRERFTEVSLEIENIGEEEVNNLELEPRFSEDMDWQGQSANINSLNVGEVMNESVFVNPGETVDPGMYQIPVYASNPDADISMQHVSVQVTQDIFTAALTIDEAPQDIRFEMGQNYTVPMLLRNNGEGSLTDVEIELQNAENCGGYTTETISEIEPDSTVSTSIEFTAAEDMEECSATVIASSDAGEFAFSEMDIETVEEIGIVPEEFRIPIVASMWTLMLLAYAVLTKRYGMHNLTVKMPLIVLVIGEAFILIYLSSVYYDLMPPGLLPF